MRSPYLTFKNGRPPKTQIYLLNTDQQNCAHLSTSMTFCTPIFLPYWIWSSWEPKPALNGVAVFDISKSPLPPPPQKKCSLLAKWNSQNLQKNVSGAYLLVIITKNDMVENTRRPPYNNISTKPNVLYLHSKPFSNDFETNAHSFGVYLLCKVWWDCAIAKSNMSACK